jgi:hypothetical protein
MTYDDDDDDNDDDGNNNNNNTVTCWKTAMKEWEECKKL